MADSQALDLRAAPRRGKSGRAVRRLVGAFGSLGLVAGTAGWAALVLLSQVTPALFPGQELNLGIPGPKIIQQVVESVPQPLKVQSPGAESVFNRPIVILAVGTDTSADLASTNTDTIMLAELDPVTKEIAVLSIPRDLLIEIEVPGDQVYEDRVNSSFGAGARRGGTIESGMEQLAADLERNFGVKADYWVMVDFRGAEQLFDAIGGVVIDIPEELSILRWYYSDDDRPARWLSFPPGLQHLDGYEAVAFSRLREFDDDFRRIDRQQLVMEAALSQGFSAGKLDDIPGLYAAYGNAVTNNVPKVKIVPFSLLIKQSRGQMKAYSLGDPVGDVPTVKAVTTRGGAAVLEGNPVNLRYWFGLIFGPRAATGGVISAPDDGNGRTSP